MNESFCQYKEIFDPVFVNIKVIFPSKYEAIFKGVSEIPFIFKLQPSKYIEIHDIEKNKQLAHILAEDFELFDFRECLNTQSKNKLNTDDTNERYENTHDINSSFVINNNRHIAFIFKREQCKAAEKQQMNKKYKESIKTGIKFTEETTYKKLKDQYLEYQCNNFVNFVFIENSEHLHSQIKSLVSILNENYEYVPKTKKFLETEQQEHLRNLIQMIPGVSDSIGYAITQKYKTISELKAGLSRKTEFTQIRVEEEGTGRTVSEKIFDKLYKAFYSVEGNEKI